MSAAGIFQISVRTPIGEQNGQLTVVPDGGRFSGSLTGDLGAQQIADGSFAGDSIAWRMDVTTPMKLSLDCEATVTGDILTGTVKAGFLGSFPMNGTRLG